MCMLFFTINDCNQGEMWSFYDAQTTKLAFDGKKNKVRYSMNSYSIA